METIKLPKRKQNKKTGNDYQYVYFIRIGKPSNRLFKIGTTCEPIRRMKEHAKNYQAEITVLWLSPPLLSRYTTLRVEDRMREQWKKLEGWGYERLDRFYIPKNVKTISIKIKKEYSFKIA